VNKSNGIGIALQARNGLVHSGTRPRSIRAQAISSGVRFASRKAVQLSTNTVVYKYASVFEKLAR
jgi:hypothetical protein